MGRRGATELSTPVAPGGFGSRSGTARRVGWLLVPLVAGASSLWPADLAERARADQVWSRTYRVLTAFDRSLTARAGASTTSRLAQARGLDEGLVRTLLIYALNYGAEGVSAKRVMGRYPHYSLAAVIEDLERLERAGWLEPVAGRDAWNLGAGGRELVGQYFDLETERTSSLAASEESALEVVSGVLEAVGVEAGSAGDDGYNQSIRFRREGPRAPDAASVMVRAMQALRDLVAFVNDNAHYRFLRWARASGESAPPLGPLARELLAAMREGREYPASRCAEQPQWRVEPASCQAAMAELADAGLAENVVGEVFRQTGAGARYFAEAEAVTDERLYRGWRVLSEPDYEEFLAALDLLEAATPRP